MQRRSVVGRLAATLAGMSLVKVPDLSALTPPTTIDADTWPDAPQSPGTTDCPQCGAHFDYLVFTPSGLCPICAGKADPAPNATLRSNPFWLLTPQEIGRLEVEILRLAAEAKRLDESSEALARDLGDGSEEYEAEANEYYAVERERLLLHMLHAASRQYQSSRTSRLV